MTIDNRIAITVSTHNGHVRGYSVRKGGCVPTMDRQVEWIDIPSRVAAVASSQVPPLYSIVAMKIEGGDYTFFAE